MAGLKKFNDQEKWCNRCKSWLPLDNFSDCKVSSHSASGKRGYCKPCDSTRNGELAKRPDDHRRIITYMRDRKRRKSTGLSSEEIRQLWELQNERCAICSTPVEFESASLDHSHQTGKARGFLCSSCNLILGHSKDDPSVLQAAINYLIKHQGESAE